jgi:predicted DNA-binding protein YlxM (UPF0122 family)
MIPEEKVGRILALATDMTLSTPDIAKHAGSDIQQVIYVIHTRAPGLVRHRGSHRKHYFDKKKALAMYAKGSLSMREVAEYFSVPTNVISNFMAKEGTHLKGTRIKAQRGFMRARANVARRMTEKALSVTPLQEIEYTGNDPRMLSYNRKYFFDIDVAARLYGWSRSFTDVAAKLKVGTESVAKAIRKYHPELLCHKSPRVKRTQAEIAATTQRRIRLEQQRVTIIKLASADEHSRSEIAMLVGCREKTVREVIKRHAPELLKPITPPGIDAEVAAKLWTSGHYETMKALAANQNVSCKVIHNALKRAGVRNGPYKQPEKVDRSVVIQMYKADETLTMRSLASKLNVCPKTIRKIINKHAPDIKRTSANIVDRIAA